jgi:hypothetical protein
MHFITRQLLSQCSAVPNDNTTSRHITSQYKNYHSWLALTTINDFIYYQIDFLYHFNWFTQWYYISLPFYYFWHCNNTGYIALHLENTIHFIYATPRLGIDLLWYFISTAWFSRGHESFISRFFIGHDGYSFHHLPYSRSLSSFHYSPY